MMILGVLLGSAFAEAQTPYGTRAKGDFYAHWGWNWSWYTDTDISFKGDDHDFTLHDVVAKDRQSEFSLNKYFNPTKATIPQYNFRVGYFLNEQYSLTFGIDHMKYVVEQGQWLDIEGSIDLENSAYNGQYNREPIQITYQFLKFEHTDGLNSLNLGIRRHNDLLLGRGRVKASLIEGFALAAMLPRTDVRLMQKQRNDEFKLAGAAVELMLGINIRIGPAFFIQTELKGGYINLPAVRTTPDPSDGAKMDFLFTQYNFSLGAFIGGRK